MAAMILVNKAELIGRLQKKVDTELKGLRRRRDHDLAKLEKWHVDMPKQAAEFAKNFDLAKLEAAKGDWNKTQRLGKFDGSPPDVLTEEQSTCSSIQKQISVIDILVADKNGNVRIAENSNVWQYLADCK